MAFRLMDFGIPNFDTNVDYLYKTAVEHGESHVCGDEEYIAFRMQDTPMLLVLRFQFEEDGETPASVVAHTFLDNEVRWHDELALPVGDETAPDMAKEIWRNVEIINPTAAGDAYIPMMFADRVKFGRTPISCDADYTYTEGQFALGEHGELELLARVESVTPIIMSKLWLFSVVRLKINGGFIEVPVGRDAMEKELDFCKEGDLCFVQGPLSFMKTWE